MGGIKYYQLAKDEELPDEFCAVRDVGGEPSEYTFYVPESEIAKLREQVEAAHMSRLLTENENEKLRELLHRLLVEYRYLRVRPRKMYLQHEARMRAIEKEMSELGIEVDG